MITNQGYTNLYKAILAYETKFGHSPTLKEVSSIMQVAPNTASYQVKRLQDLELVKTDGSWNTEVIIVERITGSVETAIDFRIKEYNDAKRFKRYPALDPDCAREIRHLAGI